MFKGSGCHDTAEQLSDDDSDVSEGSDDDGHGDTVMPLRSSGMSNREGLSRATSHAWAKADSLCYIVDCSDRFLRVCGITREDVAGGRSIINLVKQSTPEKMMQQAYQLDELISGKVDASIKWCSELNESYKKQVYMIHVTLADQTKITASEIAHVLFVELKPVVRVEPQGHQVVNGHLEWGIRRRSTVNVLDRKMGLFRTTSGFFGSEKSGVSMATVAVSEAPPQLRVLLVDDSLLALKVLSRLITTEGHHVESRRSGEQALELLKNDHFDAVLITMNMPDMSGMEASLDLRRHEDLMQMYKSECGDEKLKIVAMMQAPDLTVPKKEALLTAGFDAYVAKPVTLQAFRELGLKPIPPSNSM